MTKTVALLLLIGFLAYPQLASAACSQAASASELMAQRQLTALRAMERGRGCKGDSGGGCSMLAATCRCALRKFSGRFQPGSRHGPAPTHHLQHRAPAWTGQRQRLSRQNRRQVYAVLGRKRCTDLLCSPFGRLSVPGAAFAIRQSQQHLGNAGSMPVHLPESKCRSLCSE